MPIVDLIRERGPITVAAFMELALYHPEFGYYARATRRSGRAGDFFTSVDVGPLFGELLEIQIAEMARILAAFPAADRSPAPREKVASPPFDLVEAGAGNGRLSADILRAACRHDPTLYDATRLHLVEVSPKARQAQRNTLGEVSDRLSRSSDTLPESFEGVLIANELLDAMPVHQVVMRERGLRENYVSHQSSVGSHQSAVGSRQSDDARPPDDKRLMTGDWRLATDDCRLTTAEGLPSTPELAAYLDRLGAALDPGWRVEINLQAVAWIREAARRLRRGFIILIDYGHEARQLYSASHSTGTLTTYASHQSAGPESASSIPSWLLSPGERDITSHVDFTSVRDAAEAAGLTTIGFLDQTYFLLGLLQSAGNRSFDDAKTRMALKTLVMPGGLGSTHKVMIFGKGVGPCALQGLSFATRVT